MQIILSAYGQISQMIGHKKKNKNWKNESNWEQTFSSIQFTFMLLWCFVFVCMTMSTVYIWVLAMFYEQKSDSTCVFLLCHLVVISILKVQ